MKILVTGFDAFDGELINPSWEALKQLPKIILGVEIIKIMIPTVFGKSAEIIEEAIIEYQPDVVLSVGQAGGGFGITPERVAINIDDARIPDNEGNQPIDKIIQEDGKTAYFTTLPIKKMIENVKKKGLPASLSNTAGTFVCNHIMYQVLYLVEKKYPMIKAGFVHIPFIVEQVIEKQNVASMSLIDVTKGLEAAIEAIILYKDIK